MLAEWWIVPMLQRLLLLTGFVAATINQIAPGVVRTNSDYLWCVQLGSR